MVRIMQRQGLALVTTLSLILACLASPSQSRAEDRAGRPRVDGVYQLEKHVTKGGKEYDTHYFLRFYADGTVISYASINMTVTEFWEQLDPKSPDISHGTYTVTGDKVVFTTESKYGKIDYDGKMKDDQLEFRTHSQINNHDGEEKYTFVKVKAGK